MKLPSGKRLLDNMLASSLLATALLMALPSHAEDAKPTRVRGAITAVDGDVLKVHSNRGEDVQVKLTQDT